MTGWLNARKKSLPWAVWALAGLLVACAGAPSVSSQAAERAAAVDQVLAEMAQAVSAADPDQLVALWQADARAALSDGLAILLTAPADLEISLVALRIEGGVLYAQAAWVGTFDGAPASGRFQVELSEASVPQVIRVAGELPWQPQHRVTQSAPVWAPRE